MTFRYTLLNKVILMFVRIVLAITFLVALSNGSLIRRPARHHGAAISPEEIAAARQSCTQQCQNPDRAAMARCMRECWKAFFDAHHTTSAAAKKTLAPAKIARGRKTVFGKETAILKHFEPKSKSGGRRFMQRADASIVKAGALVGFLTLVALVMA